MLTPHALGYKQYQNLSRRTINPLTVRILFPRLLVACFALSFVASVAAQSSDADGRPRYALSNKSATKPIVTETEAEAAPATMIEERAPLASKNERSPLGRFDKQLLAAIEGHLNAQYHYGGTGPEAFDCSGFVWNTFQEAGLSFTRGPARSYWATFAPANKDEQFRFGTLVFFSGLTHVGIVADEKGFYHSSRHNGVIYSPFNDYWLSRIDGFRRVPLDAMQAPLANQKARANKPSTYAQSAQDDNAP